MRLNVKVLAIAALMMALGAAGYWWWSHSLIKVWRSEWRSSPAVAEQPFLAATWLLSQNGYRVTNVKSIELLDLRNLHDGTLLIGGSEGVMSHDQGMAVLAWVARGNTLVFQPRIATPTEKAAAKLADSRAAKARAAESEADTQSEADEEVAGTDDAPPAAESEAPAAATEDGSAAAAEDGSAAAAEDGSASTVAAEAVPADAEGGPVDNPSDDNAPEELVETDPLGDVFGMRRIFDPAAVVCWTPDAQDGKPVKPDQPCAIGAVKGRSLRKVTIPGNVPITFDAYSSRILRLANTADPAWQDSEGDAISALSHGKGRVIVAPVEMFRNGQLQSNDHGSLLLALARLTPSNKHVTIIRSGEVVGWVQLLWLHYSRMLVALAALLALLFWTAVRRFGPVLPPAETARRSLMEHVDASGAWLWKANGGRATLLAAARADLHATLQRRAPGVLRLSETEQQDELARLSGLSRDKIFNAMHAEPASVNAAFTRQINMLQSLRKHYER